MLIWGWEKNKNFSNTILGHLLESTLTRTHSVTTVQDTAWPCQLAEAGRTVRMWTLTHGPGTKCPHPGPLYRRLGARTGDQIRGLEWKLDHHWFLHSSTLSSSRRVPHDKAELDFLELDWERMEENHYRFERNLSSQKVCINRTPATKMRCEHGDQEQPPCLGGCIPLPTCLFSVLKLKTRFDGLNEIVPNK